MEKRHDNEQNSDSVNKLRARPAGEALLNAFWRFSKICVSKRAPGLYRTDKR